MSRVIGDKEALRARYNDYEHLRKPRSSRRFAPTKGYSKYEKLWKPEKATVKKVKNGTYLPVSICAYIMNCSYQTIRKLYFRYPISVIQFEVGQMLVNLDDLQKYVIKKDEEK